MENKLFNITIWWEHQVVYCTSVIEIYKYRIGSYKNVGITPYLG